MRIKRHYSIIAHSADMVEIRHGVWNPVSFTLSDEKQSSRLYRIIRHFREDTSAVEVAKREDVPAAEVESLIDRLLELGALETGPSTALDYYLNYCVPTLLPTADPRPKQLPVAVLGDAGVVEEIESNLKLQGAGNGLTLLPNAAAWGSILQGSADWSTNGIVFQKCVEQLKEWRGHFLVHAAKTVRPLELKLFNRIALANRTPWLHVAVDSPFLYIGPILIPYRTSCYECLDTRILMNLREAASYQNYKRAIADHKVLFGEIPIEPVLLKLLACHAALETTNFTHTGTSFTVGKMLSIYLPTMEFSFNEVLRVPGCPACGSAQERDATELYFDMRQVIRS
jgi:bacteriocin biosynthesis cyclodehydratase domain-containing protein